MLDLDELMEETTKQKSIMDYSLRIAGESGDGKTPLYGYFARAFQKECGSDKPVCLLLPLEPRYKHIDGLIVVKPPLKDKMGNVMKDSNGKVLKNSVISTWQELEEITEALVEKKKQNPNYHIKRICFDTITKVEMLGQQEVISRDYQKTKVLKSFNEIGGRGAGYMRNLELVNKLISKLTTVGYIIDTAVQVRDKTLTTATGDEYHVKSADCAESLDGRAFLQNSDISVFLDNPTQLKKIGVNKKMEQVNTVEKKGKRLILKSNGSYKGIKSPFPNPPESLQAEDFEKTVEEYLDLFKARMSGDTSHYQEDVQKEAKEKEKVINAKIEILKEKDEEDKKTKELNDFLDYYNNIQKQMPPTAVEAWQQYFNSLMSEHKTENILEALLKLDEATLQNMYTNLQFKK